MITFSTKQLQAALKTLQPAVGSILPINDYVHVSIENNVATLRATNLNLQISTIIACESEDCKLLLPFADINNALPNVKTNTVNIEYVDNTIILHIGKSKLKLATEKESLFPTMQDIGETQEINIHPNLIGAMKTAVKFQAHNENMTSMTGICLHFNEDNTCDIVGTNSNYIYRKTLEYSGTGVYHITPDFVNAINKGHTLLINENHIGVKDDNSIIVCLLSEQKYPSYKAIYRKDIQSNLLFSLSDLLPELNLILSQEAKNFHMVTLQLLGDCIDISFEDKESNKQYLSSIKCSQNSPVDSISFNAKFLKDILLASESDEINMMLTGEKKPAYIITPNILNAISPLVKQ